MLVVQSCPTLCDPMDCSPPGSSVREFFQARILEWVAISFSRGSSWPRDQTQVSCKAGRFFTNLIRREALNYTKKDLNDPDNHKGVITYLEPDILECEVKWALGNTATIKASGGDGIPAELFKILKDDSVKVLQSIWHKFRKLSSGHRTGNCQFLFQSQRKAMPKNVQTSAQLHSSQS